jgi:hypothetical protein
VVNGRAVERIYPSTDSRRIDADVMVWVYQSSWIAARVWGDAGQWPLVGSHLFAHTGPFYIDMNGEHAAKRESAEYLASWTQSLVDLAIDRGEYDSTADSIRALGEYLDAVEYYTGLIDVATSLGDGGEVSGPSTPGITGSPNPFSDSVTLRFSVPGGGWSGSTDMASRSGFIRSTTVIEIFDVSGRLIKRFPESRLDPGRHKVVWDGRNGKGRPVTSGIYFCRIKTGQKMETGKLLLVR